MGTGMNGHAASEVSVTWRDVAGLWNFGGEEQIYLGSQQHKRGRQEYGIALSSIPFREGTVRARVVLPAVMDNETADKQDDDGVSAGFAFGFESQDQPYYFAAIGAFDYGVSIGEYRRSSTWKRLAFAGDLRNYPRGVPIELTLHVSGQTAQVSVNGVSLIRRFVLPAPLADDGFGLFTWGDGRVIFDDITIEAKKPQMFVIMPFHEPFTSLWKDVIQPVGEEYFKVEQAGEMLGPGKIVDDLQRSIEESAVVLAEVSTHSPNVYYELGYAHALKKPAILLVRQDEINNLPFDIRHYRAVLYDDSIGGKSKVEDALRQHLTAVLGDN